MGIGPVKAVPIALERAGLTLADIDVIEANEAFAAQACAVAQDARLRCGAGSTRTAAASRSAIRSARPGAIITVKALYELKRTGGRYGLITMCIGGGQGIAMVIERL